MHTLWQDVRYGLRMLAKNPGFTLIAILTLALGIGANTAIFSLIHQVLLRRLPVRHPEELVILKSPGPKRGHSWDDGDESEIFSYPVYKGIAKNTSVFNGVIAKFDFPASIANQGQTDRGSGELVTGNYFDVLGVGPALGRILSAADDNVQGAHPVAVLSHGYWTQHFAADPGVVNHTILVNNTELAIVGVARAGFTGIQVGQAPDLFVPMAMKAQMTPIRSGLDDWNDHFLAVLARRKQGVSKGQAEAAINVEYRPLLEQQVATLKHLETKEKEQFLNKKVVLYPGAQGRTTMQRDSGPAMKALFAMAGLVLLIACTNLANLLLAKAAARQREFAIRTALGATKGRMIRQLMVESLLCALGGGGLGLALGTSLMNILTETVVSEGGVQGLKASVDGSILAFAIGATLASTILFGLIPAWRVARAGISQMLKEQGSSTSAGAGHVRFRKLLVAGQVAFTLLLLAGATLFARTLWNLRQQNLGMSAENLITFSIAPDLSGYDTPKTVVLIDQLRERLARMPGVMGVGTAQIAVLTGSEMGTNVTIEGRTNLEDDHTHVNYDAVSPGYFSTMGIPLLEGREFNDGDRATRTKVAVINETMAKEFFPKRDPLGVRLALGGGKDTKPDVLIVGVVKNAKEGHVRTKDKPYFFQPYAQFGKMFGVSFYVRSRRDAQLIANDLRETVRQTDANLPVYDLKTVERVVNEDLFAERVIAGLSAGFGGLAALLAALGIYGVLAYLVVQRTREIGIRVALGAERRQVSALVFKEVGWMLIAGTVVGLPLAYALGKLSESLLYGVNANDIEVYAISLGTVALVSAIACYLPSRRATRINPIAALRYE